MEDTIELLDAILRSQTGSKALDKEIARLFGWHRVEPRYTKSKHGGWISPEDFNGMEGDGSPLLDGLHGTTIHKAPPPFTTSIDAGLLLVPTGWLWQVSNYAPVNRCGRAYIRNRKLLREKGYQGVEATAATEALALAYVVSAARGLGYQ